MAHSVNKINPTQLRSRLGKIGPSFLKTKWKNKWTHNRPTTGYCYLVSEILVHYLYPGAESYVINFGTKGGTHWFVKYHGRVIDWTGDQFNFKVPYSQARRAAFFKGGIKTKNGYISKKAHALAFSLGILTQSK